MDTSILEQHLISAGVGYGEKIENELNEKVSKEGLFCPILLFHLLHMIAVLAIYFFGYTALLFAPAQPEYPVIIILVAFVSVQAGFIAHDAGHGAITRNPQLANLIGQIFDTFLSALSFSYWQYIHNSHHKYCNEQAKDMDMQSQILSMYPDAIYEKHTWLGKFVTRRQSFLIWPLISLQCFSFKYDSIRMICKNPFDTRIDQILILLHLLLWFGPPVYYLGLQQALINYLLITWVIGPYLAMVFLTNHIGTRVIRPGDKLAKFSQQLITSRNLGDSWFSDFIFGGLNNHIEHHLFPTISSFRLRRARVITRSFCKQKGLPYREMSWFNAIREVTGYLNDISKKI